MKDYFNTAREKGGRVITAATLLSLASLGVASCTSESDQPTWRLEVKCAGEDAPKVSNVLFRARGGGLKDLVYIESIGSFDLSCGSTAPLSVVVEDEQIDTTHSTGMYSIDVRVKDDNSSLGSREAYIDSIQPGETTTHVVIKDLDDLGEITVSS